MVGAPEVEFQGGFADGVVMVVYGEERRRSGLSAAVPLVLGFGSKVETEGSIGEWGTNSGFLNRELHYRCVHGLL